MASQIIVKKSYPNVNQLKISNKINSKINNKLSNYLFNLNCNHVKTRSLFAKMNSDKNKFFSIIDNNSYVKNCVSNKNKDINSISYLIKRQLSQSDCIKFGTGFEKILMDVILLENKNLENIKPKNTKGKRDVDHLFLDKINKVIYYAEIKSNLNLDTEKSKATINKCKEIQQELMKEFPEHKINMYLVGIRYYTRDIINKSILNKYTSILDNLKGVNEYLEELGATIKFLDENDYTEVLNYQANKMFDK